MSFVVVFKFSNGDPPNYAGPFDKYNEATYFRDLWAKRFKEKGTLDIIRIEEPKTPDQCRLPKYAK